jgi:hypothetical protein
LQPVRYPAHSDNEKEKRQTDDQLLNHPKIIGI